MPQIIKMKLSLKITDSGDRLAFLENLIYKLCIGCGKKNTP